MEPMSSAEIRERFQRFFEERGHTRVPPAALLAKDDPTLLFVNSGMAPFKRVLTGEEKRDYVRAVDAQPCLRVAGKHNDFEEVGRTPRHQTLFEMLGNWSFGDYFKAEAIHWAWELLTDEFGIDPDRIAATVYTDDEEAHRIWSEEIGLPSDRLVRWGNIAAGDEKNFWRMGDTGPCGPCSELHYDRGAHLSEGPECIPDHSEHCPRWLEIWNLVFMEFDRAADGGLTPLPFKSVDTGMGLERMASAVQGVDSNYRTDLFAPIIERLAAFIGHDPETVESERFSYQVVADHSRAMTFLLAEGVTPSNEGAGYVLRRIMRRAVRHGRLLGIQGPFLRETCSVVVDILGEAYPSLVERRDAILDGVEAEEEKFARTLEAGSARLAELVAAGDTISGADAFRLHDTFGFPIDLTVEVAAERGVTVDRAGLRRGDGRAARAIARRAPWRAGARPRGRGAAIRVHRLPERDERRRPAACSRSFRASRRRSCSIGRRSTPRAAARSVTEASSSARAGASGSRIPSASGRRSSTLGSSRVVERRRRGPRRGRRGPALGGGAEPHRHAPAASGAARRAWREARSRPARGLARKGCGSTFPRAPRRRARRCARSSGS